MFKSNQPYFSVFFMLISMTASMHYKSVDCDEIIGPFTGFECVPETDHKYHYSFGRNHQTFLVNKTEENRLYLLKRKLRTRNSVGKDKEEENLIALQGSPYVPQLIDSYKIKDYTYTLIQYQKTTSLKEAIMQDTYFLNNRNILIFFLKIVNTMNYFKGKRLILPDINHDSIRVTEKHNPYFETAGATIPYLSDFTPKGSPNFLSPQKLEKWKKEEAVFGEKAVVWSMGVLLYYMTQKRLPFTGKEAKDVSDQIRNKTSINLEQRTLEAIAIIIDNCLKRKLTDRVNLTNLESLTKKLIMMNKNNPIPAKATLNLNTFLPITRLSPLGKLYSYRYIMVVVFIIVPFLQIFITRTDDKFIDEKESPLDDQIEITTELS